MKITALKLYTDKFEEQLHFFQKVLGFDIEEKNESQFSLQVGWTKLIFEKSSKEHHYHYCFLIPSNKLDEAIIWLQQKLKLIQLEVARVKQVFESWNAESIYFYDEGGNLAEFIVRYDLKNDGTTPFTLSDILCVNEIGLPTNNIEKINAQLEEEINSKFWKGDKERFGTNGDNEGLYLLPNYEVKKTWFPTEEKIKLVDFYSEISNQDQKYKLNFEKQKLTIEALN